MRPRPINFAPPAKAAGQRQVHAIPTEGRQWFRVENSAAAVDIYVYEEIGGWFGVSAGDFVDTLRGIGATPVNLHLNSPGGDVWDGVAIYNAIRNHPAQVTVHVDGLAASAASFIAMAGDSVLMAKGSTLMIHDALCFTIGNAADHVDAAGLLEKVSGTIAGIYADKAGGTVDDWRAAMQGGTDGTWYTADEAVAAGLADAIAEPATKTTNAASGVVNTIQSPAPNLPGVAGTSDAPPDAKQGEPQNPAPASAWDLGIIRTSLKEAFPS